MGPGKLLTVISIIFVVSFYDRKFESFKETPPTCPDSKLIKILKPISLSSPNTI